MQHQTNLEIVPVSISMSTSCIVIGSGPAGVAAAQALLMRGVVVVLLDVGVELEKTRQQIISELQSKWNASPFPTL